MLGEFNRVFNVDADTEEAGEEDSTEGSKDGADAEMLGASDRSEETHRRRNSRQYSSGAADQLLGLSGRSLTCESRILGSFFGLPIHCSFTAAEEGPSDDDSVQYESGTETTEDNVTAESSSNSSPGPGSSAQHEPLVQAREALNAAKATTKASSIATSKGLNVSVTQSSRGNRYSTMMGLPASPRPPQSPRVAEAPS